tara:strand:+ start:302 stop:817 length:516 start_codon:yes stop_codon:yes gene_type:complete
MERRKKKRDRTAQTSFQEAREIGLVYLSRRARSAHEVAQRLKQKEFSEEVIVEVLSELGRLRFVDDRAYARRWIEARIDKAAGARKLSQDLRRKGIAVDVIDELLSEYSAQLGNPDRAVDLLRKQVWRYRSLEREKAQRRMLGFLARRGYDAKTAWESVEHVWKEIEEDEV